MSEQTGANDGGTAGAGTAGDGDSGTSGNENAEGLLDLATKGDEGNDGAAGDGESGQDGEQTGKDGTNGEDRGTPGKFVLTDEQRKAVPEKYFDKKTGELKLDALVKAEGDLRKRASEKAGGEVPDKPEDYKFEVPDDLKDFEKRALIPDPETGEDPVVAWFRNLAHEKGMGNELANDLYVDYLKRQQEMMPSPLDVQQEKAKLGPNAQAYIDNSYQFAQTMFATGVFDQAMVDEYHIAAASADGLRMLHAIREHYGEMPLPARIATEAAGSESASALMEKTTALEKEFSEGKISEDVYQRRNEQLMAEYEKVYGKEPSGSSVIAQ